MAIKFNEEALKEIRSIRLDTRTSELGCSLGIVRRISSGTTGDYFGRGAWQSETVTWCSGVGGYSRGYTYDREVGGVIENRGTRFVIANSHTSTLKGDQTYVRYLDEDYLIDSINDLPETEEVIIDCSRLK